MAYAHSSIPKDKMTPKERLTAFFAGQPYDRVPCKPFLGQNASKYFGSSNLAFNTSPKAMTDVLVSIFHKFRPDSITVNAGLQSIPEALGTKLRFNEYGPPVIDQPGLTNYAQLPELEELDITSQARMPNFFEAFLAIREQIGDEVIVDFSLGGPFTAAVLLVGLDRFMRDTVHAPESLHRVLRLTTKAAKSFIDKAVELGSSAGFAEPIASTSVISPKTFRDFAKPYLKELALHLKTKHNRNLGLHICGKTKKIWLDLVDIELGSFSLDNVESLNEAREIIGEKMIIIGNVPPIEVLKDGTPNDVFKSSKDCIKAAKDSPQGFILASGCEILVDTPAENILAMLDSVRLYGQR